MFRFDVMHVLAQHRAIGIVRSDNPDTALHAATTLIDAGLRVVEVALTTPEALDVIGELSARRQEVLIGAGTVLDAASCRLAILAGARFVVAPSLDADTLRTARRYGAASLPGVGSPTEALVAMEEGADAVKLFPASAFGPSYIREVRAALPQVPFVPTGGIGVDEIRVWLDAGAIAVGLGSALTKADDPVTAVKGVLSAVRST